MKSILSLILGLFIISNVSCLKELSAVKGPQNSSNSVIADRVWQVKNTGKYSDTSKLAKQPGLFVLGGNSLHQRMIYSNWDLTWINKGYPLLNRAIGGTTWGEKIVYTDALYSDYHPKCIILYDGENEYSQWLGKYGPSYTNKGVSWNVILPNFNRAYDSIRAHNPDAYIIVTSLLTNPKFKRYGFAPDIKVVNESIGTGKQRSYKQRALSDPKGIYLDIRYLYPTAGTDWDSDSIHVKLASYPKWYNKLKPVIDSLRQL